MPLCNFQSIIIHHYDLQREGSLLIRRAPESSVGQVSVFYQMLFVSIQTAHRHVVRMDDLFVCVCVFVCVHTGLHNQPNYCTDAHCDCFIIVIVII